MTERGSASVERQPDRLTIGPSALGWQGDQLTIRLDEVAAPLPRRVRGRISVTPMALPGRRFPLDDAGRHIWQPIAPMARLSVCLEKPALTWSGTAYLDSNFGDEPLEAGFRHWTWSRAHLGQRTLVLYDSCRRDGSEASLALRFDGQGGIERLAPPPFAGLPRTVWRLSRRTRADSGSAVTLRQTLEDTPFYARSLLQARLYGEEGPAFHESLSLDRFDHPITRLMLPFRMPRRLF